MLQFVLQFSLVRRKKYNLVFKSFQQLMIVNFSMMNIIKKVITFTQFAG